jgi:type IV pilus assembly protein PilA
MWRGRAHISDSRGFTMVELLVVILLLAILAVIALPSFIGQRSKGQDTDAQTMIRSAQIALRTYETDHDTFDVTRADLERIEPAIASATADFDVSGTATTYTITEHSKSDTTFTLTRNASGTTKRTCSIPGRGLCRTTADADGNRW